VDVLLNEDGLGMVGIDEGCSSSQSLKTSSSAMMVSHDGGSEDRR